MIDIAIVLVEPARATNIGATARAMNTMGFDDLRVVGPAPLRAGQTYRVAHRSGPILDAARHYSGLADALADRDLTIATTGRRRAHLTDYLTPDDLYRRLAPGDWGRRVALVFGREESGLTNDELALCETVSAIPMRRAQPSLNLAQAVMVYTYALSRLRFTVLDPIDEPPPEQALRRLRARLETDLPALGIRPGLALFNRILERCGLLTRGDVSLAHSVLKGIERILSERKNRSGD